MAFDKSVDPKIAKAIEEDIAVIDGKQSNVQLATDEVPSGGPCDCSGGPGKNQHDGLGTGLLDDYTICPKCNGSGKI